MGIARSKVVFAFVFCFYVSCPSVLLRVVLFLCFSLTEFTLRVLIGIQEGGHTANEKACGDQADRAPRREVARPFSEVKSTNNLKKTRQFNSFFN